jgi:hypothetical protein
MIHAAQVDKMASLGLLLTLIRKGKIREWSSNSIDIKEASIILEITHQGVQYLGEGSYLVQGLLSHPGLPVSPYYWIERNGLVLDPCHTLIKGGLWSPAYHELRRFFPDVDIKEVGDVGVGDGVKFNEIREEAQQRLALVDEMNTGGAESLSQRLSNRARKIMEDAGNSNTKDNITNSVVVEDNSNSFYSLNRLKKLTDNINKGK